MVKFSLILSLQHAIKISTNLSLQHALKISTNNCTSDIGTFLMKTCKKIFGSESKLVTYRIKKVNDKSFNTTWDTSQDFGSCEQTTMTGCMENDEVNKRKEKLDELLTPILLPKIKSKEVEKMHVIGRATASRRDRLTGAHQDGPEWMSLDSAADSYFNGPKDSQTHVQFFSQFHGVLIMPIQDEGSFALEAIKTLARSGQDPISKKIKEKAAQNKLISMEQGGRSMQIWPGQKPGKDGDQYPKQTGLYSNLGNNAIKEYLLEKNKNTTCLIPEKPKNGEEAPTSNFSKKHCREELKDLEKIRSQIKHKYRGKFPTLVKDGFYVAFSSFYWPAKNLGLTNQIMRFSDAKEKVSKKLEDKCPNGHTGDENEKDTMCMQILVLEMMLQQMIANSEGINAKIVFTNKINEKKISWTVGLAETMKKTVDKTTGDSIVVMDLGSSSTKIFGMKKKDDVWSEMTEWDTINGGDLVQLTQPEQ